MTKPSEKLAASLEVLRQLQVRGIVAIRSSELSRTHRERLCRNGFLREVIKGWYIPTRPDELAGESTAWYASFWQFIATYLQHVKGEDWCLSPEQSLSLHAENWTVPKQLLIRAIRARNNVTKLPHATSILDVRTNLPKKQDIVMKEGLRLFSLPSALIACGSKCFTQNPTDIRIALSKVRDASEVLRPLLEGGHSSIAGRLAGAFRNIDRGHIADEIIQAMSAAGYKVREEDPFLTEAPTLFSSCEHSPYVNRIRLMWQAMRTSIIERFPAAPGLSRDAKAYLKRIEDSYVSDAYHSLSIEGYHVNFELIERVRSGNWHPEHIDGDREHVGAMAARGYWQAYQAVRESIAKILQGDNPGVIAGRDHGGWYRELFAPCVAAGILRASDLAGYRNAPVYIRRSMHVPPSFDAVRDMMPVFFELLQEETEPSVRVVLGHFIFVYIHPYMDGNGRMGRFLMNVMLAGGGYPWTIVPLEKRDSYMAALEEASVNQNIVPFTDFLAQLVSQSAEIRGGF